MADEKGTGKRPQKSTAKETVRGGTQVMEREERGPEQLSESEDLKRREYRDEKGEIHHHTHTYLEQHKGELEKEKSSR
jgi:hypothetical protein